MLKDKSKDAVMLYTGIAIMSILVLTKIFPSTSIAGLSIVVGLLFFFLIDYRETKRGEESGLRFKTFFKDVKKPGVLPLVLLPIVTAVLTIVLGDVLFKGMFTAHVLGRTDFLSLDKIMVLMPQMMITALGEEIAFRGFFLGKLMKKHPFWICSIMSSLLFAIAHIAVGEVGIVMYDVITIFIDAMIYALIYKKSANCLITTIAHILCNVAGFVYLFIVM